MATTKTAKPIENYRTYSEAFDAMRSLASEYGDLSIDNIYSAWARASMPTNPFIQNRRVKGISSLPTDYSKDELVAFIKEPNGNEKPLRQTAHVLEWTTYPFRKIRKTYQALTGYCHYNYPTKLEKLTEAKDIALRREGVLLDKFCRALDVEASTHKAVGQCVQEGKIAYHPRYAVDKAHSQVNYAYLQQLPSDWWKITGVNSESKYNVSFNMMYFLTPGTDWRQFGDLFAPYVDDFGSVLQPMQAVPVSGNGKKFIYGARNCVQAQDGSYLSFDMEKFNSIKSTAFGNPELYNQNGKWAYWVTLPIDAVWVMEEDDTVATVAPGTTGLFLTFDQLADLEAVQLAILQNPLVQICLGELPYRDNADASDSDPIKLSPSSRALFEKYWNDMLSANNTSGIAFFTAPVENLHMETLAEAPNATNITSAGYSYAISKAGLSGVIQIAENPRAGSVGISARIEEAYCRPVLFQFQRMMNSIYRKLGLKYGWEFRFVEAGLTSISSELEECRKGLQLGNLSETFRYAALRGMSVWDDMAMSQAIKGMGLLDYRIPPITSYTASSSNASLPPNDPDNEGGRPETDMSDMLSGNGGESTEDSIDAK